MSISFISPIHANFLPHPIEKCGFLRFTTQFFDFGQKSYVIRPYDNNSKIELNVRENAKPSWLATTLRILALCTIIIPLIMCLGACIYRAMNNFHMYDASQKIDQKPPVVPDSYPICTPDPTLGSLNKRVPAEVLPTILKHLDEKSRIQVGSTDRANFTSLVNDTTFPRQYIIRKLHENYTDLFLYDRQASPNPLCIEAKVDLIKPLALLNSKKLLEVADTINKRIHDMGDYFIVKKSILLATVAESHFIVEGQGDILFSGDRQGEDLYLEALIMADTIDDDWKRSEAHAGIVKTLVQRGPLKAETLSTNISRNIFRSQAQSALAKALAQSDPHKALQILDLSIRAAASIPDEYQSFKSKAKSDIFKAELAVIKVLAQSDIPKAEEVANANYNKDKPVALAIMASVLQTSNPQKAAELLEQALSLAESLEDDNEKSVSFSLIAETLIASNPAKAAELLDKAGLLNINKKSRLKFLKISGLLNLPNAIQLASNDEEIEDKIRSFVAKKLAVLNPLKALEIANSIHCLRRSKVLSAIVSIQRANFTFRTSPILQ